MTLAVVTSRALAGMEAPEVVVEAHLANGLPAFTLVGLAEAEVKDFRRYLEERAIKAEDFWERRFSERFSQGWHFGRMLDALESGKQSFQAATVLSSGEKVPTSRAVKFSPETAKSKLSPLATLPSNTRTKTITPR